MTQGSSAHGVIGFTPVWRHGPWQRRILRRASTVAGLGFVGLLVVLVIRNSAERNSVLRPAAATAMAESYFAGMPQPGAGSSRLRLQEFHRTAIKDGRMIWEIRARDAQYYGGEGITHLDRASLQLYQPDGSKIALEADSAKLHMGEEGLSRAELAGNVVVEWDTGMRVETNAALYELQRSEITAPDLVKIYGNGYEVEGVGLRALVDVQRVTLAQEVSTVFSQRADAKGASGAAALFERMSSRSNENDDAKPQ